jgi:hypothetical protein
MTRCIVIDSHHLYIGDHQKQSDMDDDTLPRKARKKKVGNYRDDRNVAVGMDAQ